MIRNISGSKYIQVSGGMNTNPYISPGASGAGMVRWSASMNCLEVNDGNSWQPIHSAHPMISLSSDAETLLDWANSKRQGCVETDPTHTSQASAPRAGAPTQFGHLCHRHSTRHC